MFRWLTDGNWLIDRWRNGALHTTGTQSINRYHQQSEHTQDTSRKHRWVTSDLWWPRVTYNLQLGHYKCVGFARVHNVWKGSATMHYKYCILFIYVMYVVGPVFTNIPQVPYDPFARAHTHNRWAPMQPASISTYLLIAWSSCLVLLSRMSRGTGASWWELTTNDSIGSAWCMFV